MSQNHFSPEFRRLKELEEIQALFAQKDRIQKQISQIDKSQLRENEFQQRALDLLFKTEHSKVYAEDLELRDVGPSIQNYAMRDDSSDRDSEMDHEEAAVYNDLHLEADDVTSGYSTISSSKEEEYLSCHLANQTAAAMAARRVLKDNAGSLPGLMSSHGLRAEKGGGPETMTSTAKESNKSSARR